MSYHDHCDSYANPDLKLFEGGAFADGTIVCCGREWNVHRCVLVTRNHWFKRAFCGGMVEARTGKIILEEQDPDLVEILLRFIYVKELDLAKLVGGKQLPSLCVRLFRVGDFFLHDALKRAATAELKRYLHKTPTFHDTLPSTRQTPDWVKDVLEAVKEAYKDSSTEAIADSILSFACLNIQTVFGANDGNTLPDGISEMAVHLREKFANGGIVGSALRTRVTFGLRITAAIDPAHVRVYHQLPKGVTCQLYPVGEGSYCIFKAMDLKLEERIPSLDWVAPPANEVKKITSNVDSDIVLVKTATRWEGENFIYIRFESCVEATLYVERFRMANPEIMSTYWATDLLRARLMTHCERIATFKDNLKEMRTNRAED